MNYLSLVSKGLAFAVLSGLSSSVLAQWELNSGLSAIQFISTKNSAVAESHSFGSLAGSIGEDGKVAMEIALDSVDTLIAIRNERMRELLFETVKFPKAEIKAQIDQDVIAPAIAGGVVVTEIPITLSLHGYDKAMTVAVVLTGTSGGNLLVVTPSPILINAADFGLDKGLELLREVAGLKSISTAVPVSFQLLFAPRE